MSRPLHRTLATLLATATAGAQIPSDGLIVLGFDHEGFAAQSELITAATNLPLISSRSETSQINAAVVDPLTGELVVSGLFTAFGGSQGSLFAWSIDTLGIAAQRTIAVSHPRDAVRAIVVDGNGDFVTAGPEGIFARRRSDGIVITQYDATPGRDWNALCRADAEGVLFAATFAVERGGEIWSFDERTQRATFLVRTKDLGFSPAITGLWCEPRMNGRVFVTTLDASAPLLVLDRLALSLTAWPSPPATGLNAIAGHDVDELFVLGAGNPSSDVYQVDVAMGTWSTRVAYPVPWAATALAIPPAASILRALPDEVFLQDPLDLHLVTFAKPGAPLGLFLTTFQLQGATYQPLSPFFTGIAGPDGAVRLHLQAPVSLYGDLRSNDWMEFQGVWADVQQLQLHLTNVERITAR
ncbi:MAG: hypothetical protein H6834_06900 [Planctomycetes bacterium]|nr:hypothetical protein [Planctomycetota bacterium]